MALTEAEELELLELEETEALTGGQTPLESNPPSKTRRFLGGTVQALPFVGGISGDIAGGPVGAALGAAAGTGYKQLIQRGLEAETPGQFFTDPTIGPTAGEAAKEMALAGGTAALTSGVFRGIGKGAKAIKKLATKPSAAEVRITNQEALQALAAKGGDELAALREITGKAKSALIKAEEKAGLHFRTSEGFERALSSPQTIAKVNTIATRLADRGSKYISENLNPKEIQSLRKFLQEAEKKSGLSDIAKSEMRRAKGKLVESLKLQKPEVVMPLDDLAAAKLAEKQFPKVLRERLSSQRIKGGKDVLEGIKFDKRRKVLKALAAAGAAGTGLGFFLR